jgi:hypothetical protein
MKAYKPRKIHTVRGDGGTLTYIGSPISLIDGREIKGTRAYIDHWAIRFRYRLDVVFEDYIYFLAVEMQNGEDDVEAKIIAQYPKSEGSPVNMNKVLKKYWEYIARLKRVLEK